MYERTYGSKYDKNLSTTEIAARIRADIKAAQKAGALPSLLKVSVRKRHHNAIDLVVTECPFMVLNTAPRGDRRADIYTPRAVELINALDAMADAYNHDGSDIQTDYFDVKFYCSVTFANSVTASEREAIDAVAAL
jgi:hypothetical protein